MATDGLLAEMRDGALVLTLANPPSNALTPALRAVLIAAIAGAGPDCRRIVLAGSGPTFSSAVPLSPVPDRADPGLAALCAAVEQSPVPVIAALHGLVLGPGAELALAAAGRVAAPGSRIAWPEVALGLCPEGGTTLRLPRLVGTGVALGLLLSGRAVAAEEALALGAVDAIADSPVAAALVVDVPVRPAGGPRADRAAIAAARRAQPRGQLAAQRIIDCVEAAALLPVEAHLAFEAVARADLAAAPEAAALAAVARAERRAAQPPPGMTRQRLPPPDHIALDGAGPDLVTLARLAVAQGLPVRWRHPDPDRERASLAAFDAAEAADQRAGRLTPAARAARRALLRVGAGPAPLTIRADPGAGPAGAPLSLFGPDGGDPGLALALSPSGRACEVALPAGDLPVTLAPALAGLRRIGLQPVLVGQRPILGQSLATAGRAALAHLAATGVPLARLAVALEGFGAALPAGLPDAQQPAVELPVAEVLPRWLAALANEGLRLLEQGIARHASDIDLILVAGHGFPRGQGGPMHLADRQGLMALRRDLRLWGADNPLWSPASLLDRLIRDGLRLEGLDRGG